MAKASIIDVRELEENLSATLARVWRGQTVTVTDRNRPVALIVLARATGEEDLARTLVRSGRLSWAGGKPAGLANAPRVRGGSVADAVAEDRR